MPPNVVTYHDAGRGWAVKLESNKYGKPLPKGQLKKDIAFQYQFPLKK